MDNPTVITLTVPREEAQAVYEELKYYWLNPPARQFMRRLEEELNGTSKTVGYTACWAATPNGRCRMPKGHDGSCAGIPEDTKQ